MDTSIIKNNRGVTLTELIVAMGISSILLVFVISGSLFVQEYLKSWKRKDKLFEELSFVATVLSKSIHEAREIHPYPDSLVCFSATRERTVYKWIDGHLFKNGNDLTRSGLTLDSLFVGSKGLPKSDNDSILTQGQDSRYSELYEVFVVVSDDKGSLSDSLRSVVKNEYIISKYQQK